MAAATPSSVLDIYPDSKIVPLALKKRIDFCISSPKDCPLKLQEQARLTTFLTSESSYPIKDLDPKNIKVLHITATTDIETKDPKFMDRNFVRLYSLGESANLLEVSGIQKYSETPTTTSCIYEMKAEYCGQSMWVRYEGSYDSETDLDYSSMCRFGSRGVLCRMLRDVQDGEEVSIERLKGVMELFWGVEISRKEVFVGKSGFERRIWLEDFALGLECYRDFEEEEEENDDDDGEEDEEDDGDREQDADDEYEEKDDDDDGDNDNDNDNEDEEDWDGEEADDEYEEEEDGENEDTKSIASPQ